jgi:predicted nucleic acid-binding protein
MSTRIFVVDTSYLIELIGCGRDANPRASKEIKARFTKAARARSRFFMPLPVLFELGDHIADVRHEKKRLELTQWLVKSVKASLEKQNPFIITPADNPAEILPSLLARFEKDCPKMGIGLVDCFTAMEARRLKCKKMGNHLKIHIWTNDRALKSQEPDKEVSPYLW